MPIDQEADPELDGLTNSMDDVTHVGCSMYIYSISRLTALLRVRDPEEDSKRELDRSKMLPETTFPGLLFEPQNMGAELRLVRAFDLIYMAVSILF